METCSGHRHSPEPPPQSSLHHKHSHSYQTHTQATVSVRSPPPVLTVGALQLGHGGHEGVLGHVALHRRHEWLLVGRVQRLGELHRLQGGQAAAHAVDDGHTLCLCGGQTWSEGAGVSTASLSPLGHHPRLPSRASVLGVEGRWTGNAFAREPVTTSLQVTPLL